MRLDIEILKDLEREFYTVVVVRSWEVNI